MQIKYFLQLLFLQCIYIYIKKFKKDTNYETFISYAGIICLILQITLIGWLPAALWAVYALSQYKTDKKIKQAMQSQSN